MTSLVVRTAVKRAQISLSCAVIICARFLPASGKITRKVNPTITSSYLYCKTESPAQLSEDWKRQNVLQSLNCGLGLQIIFFPRENLIFSIDLLVSPPSSHSLSPGNRFKDHYFFNYSN